MTIQDIPTLNSGAQPPVEGWLTLLDLAAKSTIFVLIAGLFLSLIVHFAGRQTVRSSVFLALRSDYARILDKLQRDLPGHNTKRPLVAFHSLSRDAKQSLRAYWIHSLNEYVITNEVFTTKFPGAGYVLRKDSLNLWRRFYARAQSSALDLPLFKTALEDLIIDENFSFGGHREEYLSALEKAYSENRSGKITLPRNRSSQNFATSSEHLRDGASELSQQIIKNLREKIDDNKVSNEFRSLIDEAETLQKSNPSVEFQNEFLAGCLALQAAVEGDFGVGAVLLNRDREVIGMAKNTVFSAQNTSRHAEMNLISGLHIDRLTLTDNDHGLEAATLISSLEPCPMCLSRISMTPIKNTIYLSPDPEGGMVSLQQHLPEVWQGFLREKTFTQSGYSNLSDFSKRVFDTTKSKDGELSE
jgi:tRNA(Arg) A34 adenosine deaminase TadA